MKKLLKSAYVLLAPLILSANLGITSAPDVDGVITYTQIVDGDSSIFYRTYEGTTYDRFDLYGGKNTDFGWKHDFPDFNTENVNIVSAKLLISAFDVDAETSRGLNGEYNQISIDGNNLNPGFLLGANQITYQTTFNIPLGYISDDGEMSVFMDIDIRNLSWKVTIPKSTVEIKYKIIENEVPYKAKVQPVVSAASNQPLTVTISGSDVDGVDTNALDPDNNSVTYKYDWFVDVGQGEHVTTEFAGKGIITGNTVAAEKVLINEKWRVLVTPNDVHGAIGETTLYDFPVITEADADNDSIIDSNDEYINDATRAFNLYYPAKDDTNTLMFEDTWPSKGDYDMNDVVINFNYKFVTDANNLVKDIYLSLDYKAYGGIIKHGFAVEIADLDRTNILNITRENNGDTVALTTEAGHSGDKTVIVVTEDLTKYMPIIDEGDGNYTFFNTQNEASEKSTESFVLHIELDEARAFDISKAPFNPFIFRQFNDRLNPDQGRDHEIHLIDHAPSDLADSSLFNTKDDASVAASDKYYRTTDGLPWAIEVSGELQHAAERTDFLSAYPDMWDWAKQSGSVNTDWHQHRNIVHTWKNK